MKVSEPAVEITKLLHVARQSVTEVEALVLDMQKILNRPVPHAGHWPLFKFE